MYPGCLAHVVIGIFYSSVVANRRQPNMYIYNNYNDVFQAPKTWLLSTSLRNSVTGQKTFCYLHELSEVLIGRIATRWWYLTASAMIIGVPSPSYLHTAFEHFISLFEECFILGHFHTACVTTNGRDSVHFENFTPNHSIHFRSEGVLVVFCLLGAIYAYVGTTYIEDLL